MRLESCKGALEKNHCEVFLAQDCVKDRTLFNDVIFPPRTVKPASWGDSMSMDATGILEDLKILTFIPEN